MKGFRRVHAISDNPPTCDHSGDMEYIGGRKRKMPSMALIFQHWRGRNDLDDLLAPELIFALSKGTFPCFGCLRFTMTLPKSGWDRAHLQDVCLGGSDLPDNIVPLCSLCHTMMTQFYHGCRNCALDWLNWLLYSPRWWGSGVWDKEYEEGRFEEDLDDLIWAIGALEGGENGRYS